MLGSTHFYYTNKWKIERKNEGFLILEMVVVLLRTGIMGLTGRAKCNDTLAQSNVGERETRREMKSGELLAGLTISAKFRRNFGKFFVSASYRDPKFRYFSIYFVSKFNKFRPKFNEIRRNLPKFRNGIPFPLNTGI